MPFNTAMATKWRSPTRWRPSGLTWRGLSLVASVIDARYVARAGRRKLTAARTRRAYEVRS
jgi:hypothetical protein